MTINGIFNQDTGEIIFQFDTYVENTYHNSNTVAFEPLENGTFSSDSKQNTPYQISITAIKVIVSDIPENSVDQIKSTLESLAGSDTLLLVSLQPLIKQSTSSNSQYSQYGKLYSNLTLYSLDYQNTPNQLEFMPVMLFQEIRLTNTEYTASQNTANPENSSTSNQGQVQPVPQDNSLLKSWFG